MGDRIDDLFTRQLTVYSREGQEKLASSVVLMIGCGGLGSTCGTILSRSGVGHLVIVDCDIVSLSNIHRQLLYAEKDIDRPKVEVAAENPLLSLSKITPINTKVDTKVAEELILKYKPVCVMDCTDNFKVRFDVNAACAKLHVPFIFGSITALQGQVSVFNNTQADPTCPCFACLGQSPKSLDGPPPVVPGICAVTGTLQAQQAIYLITGTGKVLTKEFLTVDLGRLRMRTFKIRDRNPDCPICGEHKHE